MGRRIIWICGFIVVLSSLLGQPIQHYSCFISYSSKDDEFARRLHADLQDKGVRCWFAPHDMKIGAKIRDPANLGGGCEQFHTRPVKPVYVP